MNAGIIRNQLRKLPGCTWMWSQHVTTSCPGVPHVASGASGLTHRRFSDWKTLEDMEAPVFGMFLFLQKCEEKKTFNKKENFSTAVTAVHGHFPSLLKMLSTCNLMLHYQLIRWTAKALRTRFLHSLDAASTHLQLDRSEGVEPTGES